MPSQTKSKSKGKQQAKAVAKNEERVTELIAILYQPKAKTMTESMHSNMIIGELKDNALELARVTRSLGAGHLEVTLQDGKTGAMVKISPTVGVKGCSNTKTDRANCMSVGDTIIICGGYATAKVSAKALGLIKIKLEELNIKVSSAIFAPADAAASEEDDDLFEVVATEEEVAAASAGAGGKKKKAVVAADVEVDDI
jgi:hypothetical protein